MGNPQKLGNFVNALFQDASNNVGIGGSPSGTYKLEVTGTAKVSSTLLVSGAATFSSSIALSASSGFPAVGLLNRSSDNNLYMVAASSGFVLLDNSQNTMYNATPTSHTWQISNSPKMTLNSSGNVGIGTTSPNTGKLEISTGGNRNVVISNDDTDTGYNIVSLNGSRTKGAYAGLAGGGTADNNLYLNSGVDIVFQTGASFTQRMRTLNEFTLAGSVAGTGGPTQVIGTTSMCGILFVSIGTQNCAAIFIINAASAPVLVSQTTVETRFSITNDSGNTANVYVSGTNIVLRNNIQATRAFYCQFFGKL